MDLSNLKPAFGSTKTRKRVGRGSGSGLGLAGRTPTTAAVTVCGGRGPTAFRRRTRRAWR